VTAGFAEGEVGVNVPDVVFKGFMPKKGIFFSQAQRKNVLFQVKLKPKAKLKSLYF
jgi:hypothetical protein